MVVHNDNGKKIAILEYTHKNPIQWIILWQTIEQIIFSLVTVKKEMIITSSTRRMTRERMARGTIFFSSILANLQSIQSL